MPHIQPFNQAQIQTTMRQADIPGLTAASIQQGVISEQLTLGTMHQTTATPVTETTVFGAASLSKPVFAYLVLKLMQRHENLTEFNLDTPLSSILSLRHLNLDGLLFNKADLPAAEKITARMVLSHSTGFPLSHNPEQGPFRLQFEPGTAYGYSGISFIYLQQVIEKLTASNLQTLAEEHVFKNMPHSRFCVDPDKPLEACAANSLYTTASDYALFVHDWMHDPDMQEAFVPQINLINDKMTIGNKVSEQNLSHVAWGLGVGLELNDAGQPISAYHSGDMNMWRTWVGMNLEEKTAVVYFSNATNGHILAEQMITPNVNLEHASPYFFTRFDFAKSIDELRTDWQTNPSFGLAGPSFTEKLWCKLQEEAKEELDFTGEKLCQYLASQTSPSTGSATDLGIQLLAYVEQNDFDRFSTWVAEFNLDSHQIKNITVIEQLPCTSPPKETTPSEPTAMLDAASEPNSTPKI